MDRIVRVAEPMPPMVEKPADRFGAVAALVGQRMDADQAGLRFAGSNADDPLAGMMDVLTRELEADGAYVAWHRPDNAPVPLFMGGARDLCAIVAHDMLDIEAPGGQRQSGFPGIAWHMLGGPTPVGILSASVPAGSGFVTLSMLFRRIGESTRERARGAAARMLPLLRPFFHLWSLRSRAMAQVRALTCVANRSEVGVLIVDRLGQLSFANAAAERMLADRAGLRRSGRMLGATRLADTMKLQSAIEHVVSAGVAFRPSSVDAAPVIAIGRGERRPLLAAIGACDAAPDDAEDAGAAIIHVFDPETDLRPLIEPVCKFYGLSPVEAKLACLLADGLCLTAAAEQAHIREQTARSYLKQIFLKTNTNRQAELVWLMLKSAVRTNSRQQLSFI